MSSTEISSLHQLSEDHLTIRGILRQNAKMAAQLMSRKVGTALCHYLPGVNTKEKQVALSTGKFILLVNNWLLVTNLVIISNWNSYVFNAATPNKKPYGTKLPLQNEVLNNIIKEFTTMKCLNPKNKISGLQTFQKDVIISCKSLQQLYLYLKEEYDIEFILTHRLNQDALESLFSQIRGRGGLNDHPTPLDALYRLRMIILGKNPGVIINNSNTHEVDPDDFLTAKIVKTAEVTLPIETVPEENLGYSFESIASPRTDTENIIEEDGIEYLAGWVARKYKRDFPDLAEVQHTHTDHNYLEMPSWLSHLSFGGLSIPSSNWLSMVRKIEKNVKSPFI